MNLPQIQLIPLHTAVSSEQPLMLDVLIRIIPPNVETDLKRPTLNIGFVIDRSGSMQGQKIHFARQAACYAVEQLLTSDRVSVTIFDDQVDTLVSSTFAADKANITRQIQRIEPRNSTALHAGWVQGGVQVSQHLNLENLNRVILLSDGLANVGETNPDVIATDVHGLAKRGVSTTTMGVGNDYNEDLLEAMARSGDGNYYYIESPQQLPTIFQAELQGLIATVGHTVSLGIEPQGGVEVADVLNDLEVNRKGRYQLPNLVVGNPIEVVVRLKVPAITHSADLCYFRLAWSDPKQQERQKLRVALNLPVVNTAQLEELTPNLEVQEQVALMMAARAKKEAISKIDAGDYEESSQVLQRAKRSILEVSNSPLMQQEAQALSEIDADIQSRQIAKSRKSAHYQNYGRSRSSYSYRLAQIRNRIQVVEGNITLQQVDAIVNASDSQLSGSGGVDAAIHHAAGPELIEACRQLSGCATGEAKITKGYNLPAQWVIHTVGPSWAGGSHREAELLAQCYRSCFDLAVQHSIRTLAFPSISTGSLGFPVEQASRIAVSQVVQFLMNNTFIEKVIFVCFSRGNYECYLTAVREIISSY